MCQWDMYYCKSEPLLNQVSAAFTVGQMFKITLGTVPSGHQRYFVNLGQF